MALAPPVEWKSWKRQGGLEVGEGKESGERGAPGGRAAEPLRPGFGPAELDRCGFATD